MMLASSSPSLRIVLPHHHNCSEYLHTCSESFRVVKQIGKGTHGCVFMALHVPTRKIFGIKQVKCSSGIAQTTMKCELRALMDLCRSTGVDGEGIVQVRPTTLSRCQRCCREGGYECIEGGVWISNAGKEYMPSPLEAANLLHVVLSNTLFSMLALGVQSLQPIEIACPFLVTYYDSFPDASSGGQCLVIEYMRWGSLQERLASGHVFSTDELALVAYCVLKALAFIAAHAYVHCDIKPANILMDAKGHLKVSDFGTAYNEKSNKMDSLLAGTRLYMPPEGFQAQVTCTHKSDVWSLGVTLVHLLLGTHPFANLCSYWELRNRINSATVQNMLQGITPPEPVTNFLKQCIVICPEDRASASELLQSPFIRDAVGEGGSIHEEDPRDQVYADELNASTALPELEDIAAIIRKECAPEEEERVDEMAEQLGVPQDVLLAAIHGKSGERGLCALEI